MFVSVEVNLRSPKLLVGTNPPVTLVDVSGIVFLCFVSESPQLIPSMLGISTIILPLSPGPTKDDIPCTEHWMSFGIGTNTSAAIGFASEFGAIFDCEALGAAGAGACLHAAMASMAITARRAFEKSVGFMRQTISRQPGDREGPGSAQPGKRRMARQARWTQPPRGFVYSLFPRTFASL